MGPQGLKGDTGVAGPQGPIGLTGATGATGPQGPASLGFSDFVYENLNSSFGSGAADNSITTRTMNINYAKKGFMKLAFNASNPNSYSGSGKIDIYDPNNNLLASVDLRFGTVSASGVSETLRYWAGFKIEAAWNFLTFRIYRTSGSSNSSAFMQVYLRTKEVVLFD